MFFELITTILGDFRDIREPLYLSMIQNSFVELLAEFQQVNKVREFYDEDVIYMVQEELDDEDLKMMAYLNNKGVVFLSGSRNYNLKMLQKYLIHPIMFYRLINAQNVTIITRQELKQIVDEMKGGRDLKFIKVKNFGFEYLNQLVSLFQADPVTMIEINTLFNKFLQIALDFQNSISRIIDTALEQVNLDREGKILKEQLENEKETATTYEQYKVENKNPANSKERTELTEHIKRPVTLKKNKKNKKKKNKANDKELNQTQILDQFKNGNDEFLKNQKIKFSAGKLQAKYDLIDEIKEEVDNIQSINDLLKGGSQNKGYRKKVPAKYKNLPFKPQARFYEVHEYAQNLNTILNTDFCSLTLFFPYFTDLVVKFANDPYILFDNILKRFKYRAPNFYSILNSKDKEVDQIIKPPTLTQIHLAILELGYEPPNYYFVTPFNDFYVDNDSENTVLVYDKHVELYVGQPILELYLKDKEILLYKNNSQQFKKGYKGSYEDV